MIHPDELLARMRAQAEVSQQPVQQTPPFQPQIQQQPPVIAVPSPAEGMQLRAGLSSLQQRCAMLEDCVAQLQDDKAGLAHALESALARIGALEQTCAVLQDQLGAVTELVTRSEPPRTVRSRGVVPTLSVNISDLADMQTMGNVLTSYHDPRQISRYPPGLTFSAHLLQARFLPSDIMVAESGKYRFVTRSFARCEEMDSVSPESMNLLLGQLSTQLPGINVMPVDAYDLYRTVFVCLRDSLRVCPNCLAVTDVRETKDEAAFLVRPYVAQSLRQCCDRWEISPSQRLWMTYQMIHAVAQAHSVGVIHGNIKINNFLVSSSGWVYLTDFAPYCPTSVPADNPVKFSFFFDRAETGECCIAPERISDSLDVLSRAGDMFSLGCAIAELWTETILFRLPDVVTLHRSSPEEAEVIIKKALCNVPVPIQSLILPLFSLIPENRPTAAELISWPGFPHCFAWLQYQLSILVRNSPHNVTNFLGGAVNMCLSRCSMGRHVDYEWVYGDDQEYNKPLQYGDIPQEYGQLFKQLRERGYGWEEGDRRMDPGDEDYGSVHQGALSALIRVTEWACTLDESQQQLSASQTPIRTLRKLLHYASDRLIVTTVLPWLRKTANDTLQPSAIRRGAIQLMAEAAAQLTVLDPPYHNCVNALISHISSQFRGGMSFSQVSEYLFQLELFFRASRRLHVNFALKSLRKACLNGGKRSRGVFLEAVNLKSEEPVVGFINGRLHHLALLVSRVAHDIMQIHCEDDFSGSTTYRSSSGPTQATPLRVLAIKTVATCARFAHELGGDNDTNDLFAQLLALVQVSLSFSSSEPGSAPSDEALAWEYLYYCIPMVTGSPGEPLPPTAVSTLQEGCEGESGPTTVAAILASTAVVNRLSESSLLSLVQSISRFLCRPDFFLRSASLRFVLETVRRLGSRAFLSNYFLRDYLTYVPLQLTERSVLTALRQPMSQSDYMWLLSHHRGASDILRSHSGTGTPYSSVYQQSLRDALAAMGISTGAVTRSIPLNTIPEGILLYLPDYAVPTRLQEPTATQISLASQKTLNALRAREPNIASPFLRTARGRLCESRQVKPFSVADLISEAEAKATAQTGTEFVPDGVFLDSSRPHSKAITSILPLWSEKLLTNFITTSMDGQLLLFSVVQEQASLAPQFSYSAPGPILCADAQPPYIVIGCSSDEENLLQVLEIGDDCVTLLSERRLGSVPPRAITILNRPGYAGPPGPVYAFCQDTVIYVFHGESLLSKIRCPAQFGPLLTVVADYSANCAYLLVGTACGILILVDLRLQIPVAAWSFGVSWPISALCLDRSPIGSLDPCAVFIGLQHYVLRFSVTEERITDAFLCGMRVTESTPLPEIRRIQLDSHIPTYESPPRTAGVTALEGLDGFVAIVTDDGKMRFWNLMNPELSLPCPSSPQRAIVLRGSRWDTESSRRHQGISPEFIPVIANGVLATHESDPLIPGQIPQSTRSSLTSFCFLELPNTVHFLVGDAEGTIARWK